MSPRSQSDSPQRRRLTSKVDLEPKRAQLPEEPLPIIFNDNNKKSSHYFSKTEVKNSIK
jgi:hypothetical protein